MSITSYTKSMLDTLLGAKADAAATTTALATKANASALATTNTNVATNTTNIAANTSAIAAIPATYLSTSPGSGKTQGVPLAGLTSALPAAFVVGHRGATLQLPENTMEGFRAIAAAGVSSINFQIHKTIDGVFVVNHDSTFDRTTSYTGGPNIEAMASTKIPQVTISPSKLNIAGYGFPDGVFRPPYLHQVLTEFGGRVHLMPELKTVGAGAALVAVLNRYPAIKQSIMVCSFSYADVRTTAAAGYSSYWLDNTGNLANGPGTWAQMLTDGVAYFGSDITLTADATVTAAIAAGVKVLPWVVNRRYDRDHYLALGCVGVVSDDPIFLNSTAPMSTTDWFASATLAPGQRSNNENPASGAGRGTFTSGRLKIDATGPTYISLGALGPLGSNGGTGGTVTLTITLDAAGSDTSKSVILVLAKTDQAVTNTTADADQMMAWWKPGTGVLNTYVRKATVVTGVGGGSGTTQAQGAARAVTITITATTCKFDFSGGATYTFTGTNFIAGPWYLHVGKDAGGSGADSGLQPSFSAVTVAVV